MLKFVKSFLKRSLAYQPLADTQFPRQFIASVEDGKLPYCPPQEGDLLHELITQHNCVDCLEIGLATGSTAIYMLSALQNKGRVISIDQPAGEWNETGKANLQKSGDWTNHQLILENSVNVIPELFKANEKFDLIFVDGWKTFDHMAAEVYYLTRMLRLNKFIVFDDAAMPSVNKIINMMLKYYGYREVDYSLYNQSWRLRLFQILTTKSFRRPYRALQKVVDEADLPVTRDWNFFANF